MNLRAKKSLGQNFLTNKKIVDRIVDAAHLSGTETVIEIGPGKGILTGVLAARAKRVIAVETDLRMVEFLKINFAKQKNLEIIHADALEWQPPPEPYFLIANIPYYITSPLLDRFIGREAARRPIRAILLVQKEVAEKICASPPDMNVLALHIQPYGKPRLEFRVGRKNFSPQPNVDSAVISIDCGAADPFASTQEEKRFLELIHSAFSAKRKMLRSTLGSSILEAAKIDPTRRPETLSLSEWLLLARARA